MNNKHTLISSKFRKKLSRFPQDALVGVIISVEQSSEKEKTAKQAAKPIINFLETQGKKADAGYAEGVDCSAVDTLGLLSVRLTPPQIFQLEKVENIDHIAERSAIQLPI